MAAFFTPTDSLWLFGQGVFVDEYQIAEWKWNNRHVIEDLDPAAEFAVLQEWEYIHSTEIIYLDAHSFSLTDPFLAASNR